MEIVARLRAGLGVCVLVLLLSGCVSSPREADVPLRDTQHVIYFIYQGWHTSLLLEAEPVRRYSRHLQADVVGQDYVRIGWGDGDYFTGKSKSMGTATRALFVSDYSAVQVLTYRQSPLAHIPSETRVPLAITERSFKRLVRYLDSAFALDAQRQLIRLPAYEENTGTFYRAEQHYSLFSNCNTWSGRALQAAGLPVRSRLHLTAQSVFEQARTISRIQMAHGLVPAASNPGL
ncbi:DUF2459 domain-containing protein [Cellvibrio japonicus]|uniref:Putative lipoprotein n=1 Tax=Cellvibrio japonicus (strain Ueda107) TaxID=498211 RepID=B3PI91_CELJU|nr:DUF2459 domain-containing protein [Cellvibrio japonicus]ACE85178.1 putative lipoprotein [Cellvibrio japonicus Ueda107]QEI11133.1 DUF2459 domain-containing protein [Cellvibrio japonicus]QEI14707.1 DUF2459 domain-containing protein [Cellvibrio japonicus]QEI18287.1 DUF2459 domain-containing protein [Cellvibrio japonicus]